MQPQSLAQTPAPNKKKEMGFHDEGETLSLECHSCGHVGLQESDGFYYCQECCVQAEGLMVTGVDDGDLFAKGGRPAPYSRVHTRHLTPKPTPPVATIANSSLIWRTTQEEDAILGDHSNNDDGLGPTVPEDFGSSAVAKLEYEDYYNEVRLRYVLGLQNMIQLQCEALVSEFQVIPSICVVASEVWLRYLVGTGVLKDDWADRVILEPEPEHDDHLLKGSRIRYPNEPRNSSGQRATMIWLRHLRKAIPLSCSLAIVFLACHVVREAVLPTDIIKWCIEGKLPFLAAHVEIGKRLERPSAACPLSTTLMFRPHQVVPVQKLESMAATVAESIGMELPPVNFFEIVSRYLEQLSLPVENILPKACLIYEWSMPPDLWLSTNETKLPTRVYVLSMLIVAIRIVYDIHGFGVWERSLSTPHVGMDPEKASCSRPRKLDDDSGGECAGNASNVRNSGLDAQELLCNLEKKYRELVDAEDLEKNLDSYLQFCNDVVFAGESSLHLDSVEEELIEKFWDFYQNEKCSEAEGDHGSLCDGVFKDKMSSNDDGCVQNQLGKKRIRRDSYERPHHWADAGTKDDQDCDTASGDSRGREVKPASHRDEALRQLKLNMKENGFTYIPPRVNIKRRDYLHYARKKDAGGLAYVAHADYYILLRACARVAQVDVRIMHIGVMSFESRLALLEKRIDACVHLNPSSITCQFCSDVPDADVPKADADVPEADADLVGLSQLEI